jgi:hypothetical protein
LPTIAEGFATFRAQVMAEDAGPVQLGEMRLAFFAGSWYTANLLIELMGTDKLTEEQSMEAVERLRREMIDFQRAFTGRATRS